MVAKSNPKLKRLLSWSLPDIVLRDFTFLAARWAAALAIGSIILPLIPVTFLLPFLLFGTVARGRPGICLEKKELAM